MVGRQAAKIRCRKCEYLIQIAYRGNTEEFDVTASPPSGAPPAPSAVPAPPAPRPPKVAPGQPAALAPPSVRPRLPAGLEEGIATKKPTAAVPGLPGLGSAKGTRGAAMFSDPSSLPRRPLAPLPPPPVTSTGMAAVSSSALGTSAGGSGLISNGAAAAVMLPSGAPAAAPLPSPTPPPRSALGSTQLGDQFRESVQAGAVEDLPQEGWFVGVNGVPLGPIPLGDLRELAMAGHIDRRSLIWREGQGEWRPLGKFAGLLRVIDDGGAPSPSPLPEPPSIPPPPQTNGLNGQHVATGFSVARADVGERPSAWGDLDDEDDEDEQPTTVKGRVSVLPPPGSLPSAGGSLPPPRELPPSAPPPALSSPFGMTASVRAVPAPAPVPTGVTSTGLPSAGMTSTGMSAPPVVRDYGPASISAASDPMLDGDSGLLRGARGGSRWRLYLLIAGAVILAFALGAVVMSWMGSSSPKSGSNSTSSTHAAGDGAKPAPKPKAAEGSTAKAPPAGQAPAPRPVAAAGGAPNAVPPSTGLRVLPPAAPGAPIPGPPGAKIPGPPGSLMAGIGSPQATGPSLRSDSPSTSASGLDATAVQRTVRRYSPAVRQNCWQRALSARAPGVPSSAKVTATITIDPTGRVQAVSVAGAPRGYPNLSRCIEGSVKGWQFPRSASQTVTNVPFMFVGQ